jgi:uncharacterized protein (TIGR02646 family)
MIGLTKTEEPAVLSANKVAWTAEFVGGEDKHRYAHQDIRNALRVETYRKCAYCESRMEHVAPSNVEHITPKSVKPELVCDWKNLTLACPACNTKKGAYYSPECALVNPYADDPGAHLRWIGPMIEAVTPDRGKVTVTRLDLNRAELLYQRASEMKRALDILNRMSANPGPISEALEEDLRAMILDDAEYAAAVRALVERERAAPVAVVNT